MAKYVDGFVIPIKKKNLPAYKKMAKIGCKVWMEYGALEYYETVGDMLDFPWGRTFSKTYKLKSDETVIFAFVVYKSKAQRNQITKKIEKDPRMKMDTKKMPFDMKRFSVGGFSVFVEANR